MGSFLQFLVVPHGGRGGSSFLQISFIPPALLPTVFIVCVYYYGGYRSVMSRGLKRAGVPQEAGALGWATTPRDSLE